MPSSRHARMMRMAIVPRFATSNFLNIEATSPGFRGSSTSPAARAACLSKTERRDRYSGDGLSTYLQNHLPHRLLAQPASPKWRGVIGTLELVYQPTSRIICLTGCSRSLPLQNGEA